MKELKDLFEAGLRFHGHKCPAMPLGVERAQDKELFLRSETGKGHAAGCFPET